jgi:hypothetical protein
MRCISLFLQRIDASFVPDRPGRWKAVRPADSGRSPAASGVEWARRWRRRSGATGPLGHALHDLALALHLNGEAAEPVGAVLEESLALLRAVGDERGVACSLWFLGAGALAAPPGADGPGLELAQARLEEAVRLFRRVGDAWSLSQALGTFSHLLLLRGEAGEARRIEEERLGIARTLGNRFGIGATLWDLARLAAAEDDLARAEALLLEGLTVLHEIGSPETRDVLCDLGCLAVRRGRHARGARLLAAGAADQPRAHARAVALGEARFGWDTGLAEALAALGTAGFDRAWADGRATTLEQAVADAIGDSRPNNPPTDTID